MTTPQSRPAIGAKGVLLGLGAFAGGVAALAAAAVTLGRRQGGERAGEGAPGQGNPAPQPPMQETQNGPTAQAQPAPTGLEGHAVPDLAAGSDLGPSHRAPEAFRPDMDAPMTPAEREALRPATGPSPSLVSDEGSTVQGVGGDRY